MSLFRIPMEAGHQGGETEEDAGHHGHPDGIELVRGCEADHRDHDIVDPVTVLLVTAHHSSADCLIPAEGYGSPIRVVFSALDAFLRQVLRVNTAVGRVAACRLCRPEEYK